MGGHALLTASRNYGGHVFELTRRLFFFFLSQIEECALRQTFYLSGGNVNNAFTSRLDVENIGRISAHVAALS